MHPLYWINSKNFGDALNPILYTIIARKGITWEPRQEGKNVTLGIGSIVHLAQPGDVVWGTGAMGDHIELQCDSTTRVLACRGPLTAWKLHQRGVKVPDLYADPAILIPRFHEYLFEKSQPGYLVVPHYADVQFSVSQNWQDTEYEVLSPMMKTVELIDRLASADVVITSSLHVLIVAEAFGVPVTWAEWSDNVAGNQFKFWDYYLATKRVPPKPLQLRSIVLPLEDIQRTTVFYDPPQWNLDQTITDLLYCCPYD